MAKYSLPQSRNRRAIVVVLGATALLAIAASFGSIWVVRFGVLIALVGGAAAVWFAWRELATQRRAHRLEARSQIQRAADDAERHHVETMEVIERFSARHHALTDQLNQAKHQLQQSQRELATAKGALVASQAESQLRAARIESLETVVRELTGKVVELTAAHSAALAEIDAQGSTQAGELVALPRYGTATKRLTDQLPTARDLWGSGNSPVEIDLSRIDFPVEQRRHA